MEAPVAGWYPDPSGDATKLRFWNGIQWEDNYMAASTEQANPVVTETQTAPVEAGTQPFSAPQPAAAQPAPAPAQPANPYQAQQQTYQPVNPTIPASPYATSRPMEPGQIYPVSESDSTLFLIAFILNLITTIACAVFIVPLAWMIPMTVHTWGIYKGQKANTTAFGVCTLLFINLISGILLLVATKKR